MDVIPAIDLRDGKVVRLLQGQYDRQITYRDDPVEQARQFHADGARWLHVVDLDGAKAGKPVNTRTIAAIARVSPPPGGPLALATGRSRRRHSGRGLDPATARYGRDAGHHRHQGGQRFRVVSARWPRSSAGRLVLGLDARDSMVATHGWLEGSEQTVLEFAAQADKLPLAAIIYTDIAKDGMLCGPNIERTQALVEAVRTPVIASGGVKEVEDIRRLAPIGVAGVIVGRSLYEGTLNLKDALAACL